MSNPATEFDVERLWRPLTSPERELAAGLLDMAWAMLQTQAPEVAGVTPGSLAETNARYVLVSAVLRRMRNPDGVKSESVDDYSFTRDDATASGDLMFTEDEFALVRGRANSRAMSVSMDAGNL